MSMNFESLKAFKSCSFFQFVLLFLLIFFVAVRWYCEEEVTMRLPSGCSMQVSSTLPLVGTATNSTKLSL